jgi:CHAD domain-containing protein
MEAARPSAAVPAAAIGPAGEELLRRAAALCAAAARARAGGDADAVHDLRVAARRLEAALRVWAPAAGRHAGRDARLEARRLRRAAGRARELEVHVAMLEERLLPEAGTDRPALLPLLERLRAKRDREREAVAAMARARRLERIADRVAAVVVALAETSDPLSEADRRVRRARRSVADPLVAAADTTHDVRLHAARVAVRKWRYAAESRAAAPAPAPEPPLAELRAVQQVLGVVHDHAVLRDLLAQLAAHGGPQREPERSAALGSVASSVERDRLALLKGLPRRLRALATAAGR